MRKQVWLTKAKVVGGSYIYMVCDNLEGKPVVRYHSTTETGALAWYAAMMDPKIVNA